jgi:hypothetical protein
LAWNPNDFGGHPILADDGPDPRNPRKQKTKNQNPNDERNDGLSLALRAVSAQLTESVLTPTAVKQISRSESGGDSRES